MLGMLGSLKYEKLIPRNRREKLERALGMESGYLLDFSDRTFNDFFYETVNIDAETSQLFNGRGTSKAKRFRSFIERTEPMLVAKVLRALWEYRDGLITTALQRDEEEPYENYFATVSEFEGRSNAIDTSAIETFELSETLEELVASIRRDLEAQKPQAGLDRLHVYCMKRFASLVRKHGGGECGKEEALHSRVGRYVKLLRQPLNCPLFTGG